MLEPGFSINGADPDTYLAEIDSALAGATTTMGLQTINYGYHLRGMLNCVNCENGNPSLNPEDNDLFAYKLGFEERGQFDGNISGQSWRSKLNQNIDSYGYSYDSGKRLIQADFTGNKYGIPFMNYDLNGNILNLHRIGKLDSAYGKIDALSYTYSGNKLTAVTDTIIGNMDVGDFRDGNTSGNDYTYFINGNLKSDLNQNITNIVYDSYLNKRSQVFLTESRWIKYFYDGGGTLLKRELSNGQYWTYNGSQLYRNDSLYQMAIPDGRVVLDTYNNFQYEFEYRDHLGNLRLSYRDTTSGSPTIREAAVVSQTADYMPFGVEHFGNTYSLDSLNKQNFTYSNKEKQDDFGISSSYFGARNYNSTIGRWNGTDSRSEKYFSWSPYNYVLGNPLSNIDPQGDTVRIANGENGFINYSAGMKYEGENSFVSKIVSMLNVMNNTESGSEVLNTLVGSENSFDVINENPKVEGAGASFSRNQSGGGTLKMGKNNSLRDISHEMFHGYQNETNQTLLGTTAGEIGAYLFQDIVSFESGSGAVLPISQTAKGILYDESYNNLLFDGYNKSDYSKVNTYFKSSSRNSGGIYNSLKVSVPNNPAILKFIPIK